MTLLLLSVVVAGDLVGDGAVAVVGATTGDLVGFAVTGFAVAGFRVVGGFVVGAVAVVTGDLVGACRGADVVAAAAVGLATACTHSVSEMVAAPRPG